MMNLDNNLKKALNFFNSKQQEKSKKILLNLNIKYPNDIRILNFIGIIYATENNFAKSEFYFRKTLSLDSVNKDALFNLAKALSDQEKDIDALEIHIRFVKLYPNDINGLLNYGLSNQKIGRYNDAIKIYDSILEINPNIYKVYINKGVILFKQKQYEKSLEYFEKAISLNKNIPDAYLNMGLLYFELKDYIKSLEYYQLSLNINPNSFEAIKNKGLAFYELKNYSKAIKCFEEANSLKKDNSSIIGNLLYTKLKICDWSNYNDILKKCFQLVNNSNIPIAPFAFLAMTDDPFLLHKNSQNYIKKKSNINPIRTLLPYENHKKIKIGYFSSEFYNHPVCQLISKVIKEHDINDFEILGFSLGPNIEDDSHKEIKSYFQNYYELYGKSDEEITNIVRNLEIDIAIDLTGYTANSRSEIFLKRLAPIQINFLGFPGSLGSTNFDYIIADQHVIQKEDFEFYSEKIIFMPDSYLPNYSDRSISSSKIKKSDFDLPDNSFVYCNFNKSYKLTPKVFDIWLDILKKAETSVLWLFEDSDITIKNLLNYSKLKMNLDPNRLIFAKKIPDISVHFSRYELADIFLDTFPFNGHVTSSDALWCNLPVLTLPGKSFTSRVSSSLLKSLDLQYLICENVNDYTNKAIELYKNRDQLANIKKKLKSNKITKPTFNSKIYAKNLEKIFKKIHLNKSINNNPENIYL